MEDPENSRSRLLFSKLNTKVFKMFFCIGYAHIKLTDQIVGNMALLDQEYLISYFKERKPHKKVEILFIIHLFEQIF